MTVADQRVVVVGVVPRGFNGTWVPAILAADAWLPVRVTNDVRTVQGESRGDHPTFATPRAGVSEAQAAAALESIGRQIPTERASRTRLVPLPGRRGMNAQEFDRYGGLLGSAVLGVSALVLLIACANLANLFLARGAGRAGELAIRRAIGASSGRLVQLLLAESLVITLIAGCAAMAMVLLATRYMTAMHLPTLDGLSIAIDVSPDWRVFGYALGTAFFATVVSGLLPARRSARVNPSSALGSAGTGSTARHRRGHARLVGTQVAMSVVLLVVAGLYVRSAFQAATFNPGYDMSGLVMASVDFRLNKMTEPQGRATLQRLLEGAQILPAGRRAALTTRVPAAGPASFERIGPEDQASDDGSGLSAAFFGVSPGFFETLRLSLRRGRDFHEGDHANAPKVAIVSERVAAALWPGQDPLAKRVRVRGTSLEVVGVAANTTTRGKNTRDESAVYVPITQAYAPRTNILVRFDDATPIRLSGFRRALQTAAPDVAVFDVRPVADTAGLLLTPVRLAAIVLAVLGALGFGIAMLGVYGVMAYAVSQRTREFGVHKALGATPGQIRAMVRRQGFWLLLRGVVPGLVVAFIAAGFLRHLLYGIQPHDPITFLVVPLLLLSAGLAASYLPARRAARVDANVMLRDL